MGAGVGGLWIFSLTFVFAAYLMAKRIAAPSLVEWNICTFLIGGILILLTGYGLSYLNLLDRTDVWAVAGTVWFGVALVAARVWQTRWQGWTVSLPNWKGWQRDWETTHPLARICFAMSGVTLGVVALVNFVLILLIPPGNWDSLAYQLPRIAYYLQFRNLGMFKADYYPQVVFPHGTTVFSIWVYLFSGRNEYLLQGVQFAAYGMCILLIYGMARALRVSRIAAATGAFLFGLLTVVILESTTTQNDLVLAAFVGIAVFLLVRLRDTRRARYFVLAMLAVAVAAAVKNTLLLALPALGFVGACFVWESKFWLTYKPGPLFVRLLVTLGGVALVALPAGYFENWQVFGNPLGPSGIISFESTVERTPQEQITTGLENVLRMGLDFVSLDGLPKIGPVLQIQRGLRAPFVFLAQRVSADLQKHPEFPQSGEGMSAERGFSYDRLPNAHEDLAYWGIAGFALILPIVLASAVGWYATSDARILAWASLLCLLTVAFALNYEAWHGRRTITMAFFGAGCVALMLHRIWQNPTRHPMLARSIRVYLVLAVGLVCLSALSAVFFREPNTLYPRDPSSLWRVANFSWSDGKLTADRMALLMRNRTDDLPAMRKFEALVPSDAIVATDIHDNSFEYVLFGDKLTRMILPLNSFWWGKQPLPPQAQFLLFTRGERTPRAGDVELGNGWFLEKLD